MKKNLELYEGQPVIGALDVKALEKRDRVTLKQYIAGLQYYFDEFDTEEWNKSYYTPEGIVGD